MGEARRHGLGGLSEAIPERLALEPWPQLFCGTGQWASVFEWPWDVSVSTHMHIFPWKCSSGFFFYLFYCKY